MKKMLITISIIILVLALVSGGLIAWANASHHRINVNRLTVRSLTDRQVTLTAAPKALNLRVQTAVVTIRSGAQNRLDLTNVAADQYHLDQQNDTLSLTETAADRHQLTLGRSAKIVLTLANADDLDAVTIHQLNGTLNLTDLTTHHLEIHHHNGTTQAHRLTVTGAGRLIKDNGSTTLTQLTSAGLNVAVKNGQAHLNGRRVATSNHNYTVAGQHPLTITSGSGQVKITQ
ncbi:MAG: DUF4097 family beta strand repeat-containing protein [Levilactobacillus sp.]|jgi:DUF4097 and DUF4098 domain-containing protein YvlB|uniref:DUF4097 family beta strand repeat-containing protein n=1 Tax=Levilactobacillus sp. TaxID=2767919 RepID=UPI0025851FA6|nr:DUF4097 family beta strand repeat-containing protein [Levilactobacillus sp.]MCI1553591.1 DUF4097 family beta strand repeat-containing protein [Levilactobacillus sp.]MCI1599495.1 DUF4097 family beta strand repeat-containing protein [Levilactobacillus sp.]